MTIPPGFVLDEQPGALPEGFVLDAPPPSTPGQRLREAGRTVKESLASGEAGLSFPGVGRGLTDIRDAGSQLIGRGLTAIAPAGPIEDWLKGQTEIVEKRNAEGEKAYQESRGGKGLDTGRLLGNVLGTLPFAPPAAATLPGRIAGNALTGGGVAAISQPVRETDKFWSEKGKQAALGAGGAVAAMPIAALAAKLAAPKATTDPNIQKLLSEDVRLTPGQMAGGALRSTENKATSIPLVGDMILNRQRAGVEDLNRAALNRALSPVGEKLPKGIDIGREGVAHVQDTLSRKYGEVLDRMPDIKLDRQFIQDTTALNQAAQMLPADLTKVVNSYIQERIVPRMRPIPAGPWGGPATAALDGQTMKTIDSELGQLAKSYGSSSDAGQRELAKHLRELKSVIFGLVQRNYPNEAPALKSIDKAWGNLAVVETAAGGAGAKEGVFSANQLSSAVKRNDPTIRDRSFAAGRARMQDLSDAASSVMPSNVPDSGTAGRAMLGGTGLAGMLGGTSMVSPEAAVIGGGATGLGMLAYTPWGQKLLEAMMARGGSWRQPLAQGLLDATPALGAAAGTALAPRLGLLQ